MTKALFIIDVQNDFIEGGSCPVQGGELVAQRIGAYLRENAASYDHVVGSRDWHTLESDNGGHFAALGEPDFNETWPAHCIAGTPGAAYHSAIDPSLVSVHIFKGQGRPSFSIFEGTTAEQSTMHEQIALLDITEVDIVGIATDHCVFAAASDALDCALSVTVLSDLTAGVSKDASTLAMATLTSRGARVVQSQE